MSSGYIEAMAKTYDQDCPVARTLDLIGERWTILILRDLLLKGTRRFQDLQESLSGVAPNTLSARLKAMESQGLITRRLYSEHPPRLEYQLTERGKSLGPILGALRDWGRRNMTKR
jgi:DNA-binding HxlR family transcriptional regulator